METNDLINYYNKFKYGEDCFHYLMKNKVKEILLIATFYDAYILEQDGRLSEQIYGEYRQLNLSTAPMITSVPSGEEALKLLQTKEFDLVISLLHLGRFTAFETAKKIKQKYPSLPILLLLNTHSDLNLLKNYKEMLPYFDDIFLWNGDSKIFLAMVKSIEDKRNLDYDTKHGLVRVILLVEDSIPYYSLLLPLLYEEIVKQTQILIREELNDINKRLRMRARPKVILAHDYEKALDIYEQYNEYIIAVISDIAYERNHKIDPKAGIKLISKVKENIYDIPTILMSADSANRTEADKIKTIFIDKYSKNLLQQFRQFMLTNIGFGDFIFRNESGSEIARARTLAEFEEKLKDIPSESLIYHSKRNHFSAWLMARGETQTAKSLRLLTLQDFGSTENMREHLENLLHHVRRNRSQGKIINFHPSNLSDPSGIIRLTEGSLGGKGRGLAFLNALLISMEFQKRFPNVNITIPNTLIIGTNEFDDFIRSNKINEHFSESLTDAEIEHIFITGNLTKELTERLQVYIDNITYPLAVRSSGLLEDSFSEPFAGIYRTYMLPNNHPDPQVRLTQLLSAIKLVYASVFLKGARTYIEGLNHQLEEEKMAVIIQQFVGSQFDTNFLPHLSGICQSYNFYPIANLNNEDGIASIVVGLGKAVVEGEKHFRFCPKYPQIELVQPDNLLNSSQKDLYAIALNYQDFDLLQGVDTTLRKINIQELNSNASLTDIFSIWDHNENRLYSGLHHAGIRIANFANILQYNTFPLADIIVELLDIGEKAMGMPVEVEFAVNLSHVPDQNILPTFYILQIRPLAIGQKNIDLTIERDHKNKFFLYTEKGMGNGIVTEIRDIIYTDLTTFDKTETIKIAAEIAYFNEKLKKNNTNYVLIGPGRWGSQDRFLGIPVRFFQINYAKVIIEVGTPDFNIDPSQGTHFFHNIIATQIGYFMVSHNSNTDFIDWEWLATQPIIEKTHYVTHARTKQKLLVKMDGKHGIAAIYKNGQSDSNSISLKY